MDRNVFDKFRLEFVMERDEPLFSCAREADAAVFNHVVKIEPEPEPSPPAPPPPSPLPPAHITVSTAPPPYGALPVVFPYVEEASPIIIPIPTPDEFTKG